MNKLFEEMKALINKQNDEEFEFFVSNHQELLKVDPVLFISNHVSYYAIKEDVSKVLEVIAYYKNAPYISMTVEDLLNELKENVERLAQPKKTLTKEEIRSALLSKNEEKVASCFEYLSKVNIRLYMDDVQEFLLSDMSYKYKTLAIFILIEQKVENEIKLSKNGLIYTLVPNMLDLPFDTYEYQECLRLLNEDEYLDPQVKDYAVEIMNTCQIKEFPDSFISIDNVELMKDIFIHMAKSYLYIESNLESVAKKHSLSIEKCNGIINELNAVIIK
jgi:hypothetical protein